MELVRPSLGLPSPWDSLFLWDPPPPPALPELPSFKTPPFPKSIPGDPVQWSQYCLHTAIPPGWPCPCSPPPPQVSFCPVFSHLSPHGPHSPHAQVFHTGCGSLINVPNPVNQVSSLPCCDVSNLSALILASCLSTSTCPLSLLPLLSFPLLLSSFPTLPFFLLSPYGSFSLWVVSLSMSMSCP